MRSAGEQPGSSMLSQSEVVRVEADGTCSWWPSFVKCASHCHMDVAWFPFDEQHCHLVYESWMYQGGEMNVTAMDTIFMQHYQSNSEWHLLSAHIHTGYSHLLSKQVRHFIGQQC